VKQVLVHRGSIMNREYLVTWVDGSEASWEAENDIEGDECIGKYWKRAKERESRARDQ